MSIEKMDMSLSDLLDKLKEAGAHMSVFMAIEQGISDVVDLLQRMEAREAAEDAAEAADSEGPDDEAAEAAAIGAAIRSALDGLQMNCTVNVEPTPVQVNVAAPIVTLDRGEQPKLRFALRVTGRSDMGLLTEATLEEL